MGETVPGQRSACVRLRLLGGFRAERNGAVIPDAAWVRPTARALIKLLAVQPEHRLHQEEILDRLWPDLSPQSALGSLRKATTLARQALEPDMPGRGRSSFLYLTDGVLSLAPDTVWIDADEFEARAQAALAGEDEAAYREALGLCRGDLLPEDRYEDWTTARREAFGALRLQLELTLAGLLERRGAYAGAIDTLQDIVRQDSTREDVQRRLMRLYVASGSRHAALRQYALCRDALAEDLGVEPEEETTALYEEIASGRLSDAPATPPAPSGAAPVPLPAAIRRLPRSPLMGRARVLRLIETELAAAAHSSNEEEQMRRGVVLVGGEAGVGKTRLVAEAARIAHRAGVLVLWGGNYRQEGSAPYAPIVEALEGYLVPQPAVVRERLASSYPNLARLLPSLPVPAGTRPDEPPPGPHGEAGRLQLFAEVVCFLAEITADRSLLLALDDLQTADEGSVQLLHHLARAAPGHSWLIVGTYREEDVRPDSAFAGVRTSLMRAALCRHIDLLRLSRADCAALVASLLPGGTPDDVLLERVYALSLGNALFAEELVLATRDSLRLQDGRWTVPEEEAPVPPQIRELIVERVSRLSEATQRVLALAAAAGMESEYEVLRRAGDLEEGTLLDALDDALEARILEERGGGFAFHHPLLRETLYTRLSRARRSQLHGRLAEALVRLRAEQVEDIAHHLARAGAPEAPEWLERAGDRAAAVYATDAAAALYRDASGRLPAEDEAAQARLYERLGGVLVVSGRYDEAIEALTDAVRMAREIGDLESAGRATAALGLAHRWRGTTEEGIARVQEMVRVLSPCGASPALAALHVALAHLLLLEGRYGEALEAADEARTLAEAVDEPAILAEAQERYGTALLLVDRAEEGRRVIEEALPAIEATGNRDLLRRALQNLGAAAGFLGDLGLTRKYSEQALVVAEQVGNPDQIAFVLANLGTCLTLLGEWGAARAHLDRAVTIARRGEQGANLAFPLMALGYLALLEGDWTSAQTLLQETASVAERTHNRQTKEQVQAHLAELELLQGRAGDAVRRLEPLAMADDVDTTALSTLSEALVEAGDGARAEAVLGALVERSRAGEPFILPEVLAVQGRMYATQGRLEEAGASYCEALDLARSRGLKYVEARVLHWMGLLSMQRGDEREAQRRLEDALTLFRRLGARPYVARTADVLESLSAGSSAARERAR